MARFRFVCSGWLRWLVVVEFSASDWSFDVQFANFVHAGPHVHGDGAAEGRRAASAYPAAGAFHRDRGSVHLEEAGLRCRLHSLEGGRAPGPET